MTFLLIIACAQMPPVIDGGVLSANTVVINEFMALPCNSFTEADGEWIELYNNTGDWINLSGWVITNGSGQEVVLSTYLLPPQSYFVIAGCGDETLNGGLSPHQVFGNFRVNESGSLTLFNGSRNAVDHIEYDGGWPVMPGSSCERINPGWVSNSASTWDYCTVIYGLGDMGTPGSQNSVYQNSFAQNSWAFIKAFVQ